MAGPAETAIRGLIPAHAGSTTVSVNRTHYWWAHPRSRGEHCRGMPQLILHNGSSPLTRGAQLNQSTSSRGGGLIPAHAGSTTSRARCREFGPAHPRSRGEHREARARTRNPTGSSPLTRGAPAGLIRRGLRLGLIPAHAGSTGWRRTSIPGGRAHPRSRGEHVRGEGDKFAVCGSSPLTRGAPC